MGSAESTLPSMEEDSVENQRNHNTRPRREVDTTTVASSELTDDPWWWEIENENLLLDRVPNITTESNAESVAGVTLSEDFNTLLKIGENVNLTLNEDKNNNNDNHNNSNDNMNNNTNDNISQSNMNNNSDIKSITDISFNSANMDSSSNNTDKITSTSMTTDSSLNSESLQKATSLATTQTQTPAIASKEDDNQETVASAMRTQTLDEFKEELRLKRIARQTAIHELRDEIATLRKQLSAEQALTRRLRHRDFEAEGTLEEEPCQSSERKASLDVASAMQNSLTSVDEDDENVCSRSRHANIELANAQLALQLATSENLTLRTELTVTQKQVGTLKEVVACCKQMMAMKEEQCKQLKIKLNEIEESFGEREMKIMSDNLRQEYERQLGNIRQLRQLYEERQRIAAAEHENLQRLISIKRDELAAEQERTKSFEQRNQTLLKEVETANSELATLREECNEHKFEKKALKEEMGVVNTLFSQMLMGFNGKNNLDIDRLATMLEENRTLLNDMATKEANCSDGATLPKLLFELVEQAAVGTRTTSGCPTPDYAQSHITDCDEEDKGDAEDKDDETSANGADVVDEVASSSIMSSANKDAAGKDDKCFAAHTEAEEVDDNDDASQAMEVVEGGGGGVGVGDGDSSMDNANVSVVASDNEDNCNNQSSSNNNNNNNKENIISKNNGSCSTNTNNSKKLHHHRKTAAINNKTKISATNSNSTTSGSSTASHTSASATTNTHKLHEPEVMGQVASTQEIIGNLPKVWKVLMELLSHHKIERVQFEENGASEDCYKSVETPNGPKAELSVSKTYIKLKDLILEKKSLVKETNRLKTLNCHLDYRLNEQEKRLSAVSLELTKTWHLVGKMQRQHRQLHTQEQILRYQLQQKRRLLSELKDELEYCRRKWAAARAKNDESQEQCNDLRREFAKRKLEDANNSAESGYSDSSSGPASDEEVRTVRAAGAADGIAQAEGGRSNLREMFEHSRKIKRMQSSSPGRAAAAAACGIKQTVGKVVVMRRNSAPPTCGWGGDDEDDEEDESEQANHEELSEGKLKMTGAIPKLLSRTSRSKLREEMEVENDTELEADNATAGTSNVPNTDRAERIQRLEQQCKSLIQQVLETSDNRERLEIQLCRFQDEIAPVQYAIPLNEFITKKRIERMTRASSAPASPAGSLTAREEEYTRKRSERLGRLEEESRQLISRIKRTSDRGHYLRCSLDRLHRTRGVEGSATMSREGSFESNTEEVDVTGEIELQDNIKPENSTEEELVHKNSALTTAEEEYTRRRSERLKRLEDESKQLLAKLSKNNQRGSQLSGKLDALHEQHGSNQDNVPTSSSSNDMCKLPISPTIEKRIENIERISTNRAERLRILEEEGNQLISRLSNTSERGTRMINRIAEREQSRAARLAESTNKTMTSREGTPTTTDETITTNVEQTTYNEENSLPTAKSVSTAENISSNEERASIERERLSFKIRIKENIPDAAMQGTAENIQWTEEDGQPTLENRPFTGENCSSAEKNSQSTENLRSAENNVPTTEEDVPSTEESIPESDDNLLPILKTVACSSIVSEELAECVTVTTTSSQIAGATEQNEARVEHTMDQKAEQGAVPKTKPLAQLSVASKMKTKTNMRPKSPAPQKSTSSETLEEMVKRLRSIPFPAEEKDNADQTKPEKISEEEKDS